MAILVLVICATGVLLLPASARAFGASNALDSAEHERITRAALACPAGMKSSSSCFEPATIDQVAGKTGKVLDRLFDPFGAIGQPDIPPAEGAASHCDDADYLAVRGYPQRLEQATAALYACITHMQTEFSKAWRRAGILLTSSNGINPAQVKLSPGCHFAGSGDARAKCAVLFFIGRALHVVQDFYAHSNWADQAARGPINRNNPPGLNRPDFPVFLDPRLTAWPPIPTSVLPLDFSTGCYRLVDVNLVCKGRVRHSVLNKDQGQIDAITGATRAPTTRRGRVGSNFAKAVAGAIMDTHRQWEALRSQLLATYGPRRSSLMICALTHDNPVKDCQGRDLAIVIDSSGSNLKTDPGFLRVAAGKQFNASLTTAAQAGPDARPDRSAVIDFDDTARVISPLADPSTASFAGIDASGETSIGSGVKAAIGVLTANANANDVRDHAGMVVLTDGQDSSPEVLQSALVTASSLGIRLVRPSLTAREPDAWRRRRSRKHGCAAAFRLEQTAAGTRASGRRHRRRIFDDQLR